MADERIGVLAQDDCGAPVMLAATVDVPTRGGNPSHVPAGQPGGGRFGNRPGASAQQQPAVGVQSDELARRLDAVRVAAREFEQFGTQDIREWLKGKTTRDLSDGEIEAFMRDVRSQQLSDLVDILDQAQRGVMRNRRHVRVMAPRGYTRKTMNGLSDDELKQLVIRLRARGWSQQQVKTLSNRLPEARRPALEGLAERIALPTDLF
jgi:hypothetical protein